MTGASRAQPKFSSEQAVQTRSLDHLYTIARTYTHNEWAGSDKAPGAQQESHHCPKRYGVCVCHKSCAIHPF